MDDKTTLRRSLSLPLITFYGLGTIIGAGIYVLIGEVASLSGQATPLAFLIASVLAAFSAFSYAELSARYPLSAGEAVYVQRAFGRRSLARIVGGMLVAVGIVSAATLVNGFVGYFHVFFNVPGWLLITLLVMALGGIACWGITQSALMAALTTIIELTGLLLVIGAGGMELVEQGMPDIQWLPPQGVGIWTGVMAGAFIAFYAFIGFEDIVNVAEEVKSPTRNLPMAVILSLVISTALYLLVSVVAIAIVPVQELADNSAPLALVYERATGREPLFISLIGLSAVINGALIQFIMASRVLYGMARQGWLPGWLGAVHPRTRTPLLTTVLITLIILVLALWLPIVTLAGATSFITLSVFAMVNLSLWIVKRRNPHPKGVRVYPAWLPITGFVATSTFLLFSLSQVVASD